jgi:ferredoxin-NADP reductase/MOSC domain-containing protein YiiM
MRLLSVNLGLPQDIQWKGKTIRTGIWKRPVDGRRWVWKANIDGDGQGDLKAHGGEHRAVCVYSIESYRYWEKFLGRTDFGYGQFGENFTVEGMPDDEVCIGDRFRISSAAFEVTQPRVTCYRLGIRLNEPRMPALFVSHGRPGYYLRVLREGEVGPGDEVERMARGPDGMTVQEISNLLYLPGHAPDKLRLALSIPALSQGWRGSFSALLDQAEREGKREGNRGLATSPAPLPAWSGFRPFRIASIRRESRTVTSYRLVPADGRPIPDFSAGQFLIVRLRLPGRDRAVLRSYSVSTPPHPDHCRISVKLEREGLASTYLHTVARAGDVLDVGAPRGAFSLDPTATSPVVLASAGVGATPVLAMLAWLASAKSPRQVWWVHGARCCEEHAFAEEVRALIAQLGNARSYVSYSRPGDQDLPGRDYDAVGHLSAERMRQLGLPRESDFYLCGPKAFMRDVAAGLAAWGVPPDRVRREVFGPEPITRPEMVAQPLRPPHPPPGITGTGPQVAFARSGLTVRWDASFSSLLELAEACDVPVGWSCRTGMCHRCESGLVDGTVAYLPEPLDAPADGNVLVCCSTPSSDVVIDL